MVTKLAIIDSIKIASFQFGHTPHVLFKDYPVESEDGTYEPFGGEPWPWHEGDDEPLEDPNPTIGYSEVDDKTCLASEPYSSDWWGELVDPTDPEYGGHEQWDPEHGE